MVYPGCGVISEEFFFFLLTRDETLYSAAAATAPPIVLRRKKSDDSHISQRADPAVYEILPQFFQTGWYVLC